MRARRLEKKMRGTTAQLRAARADLAVAEEHLAHFNDEMEDARIRSLVSETPSSSLEYREADRHYQRMLNHRDDLRRRIDQLEGELNGLLDAYGS